MGKANFIISKVCLVPGSTKGLYSFTLSDGHYNAVSMTMAPGSTVFDTIKSAAVELTGHAHGAEYRMEMNKLNAAQFSQICFLQIDNVEGLLNEGNWGSWFINEVNQINSLSLPLASSDKELPDQPKEDVGVFDLFIARLFDETPEVIWDPKNQGTTTVSGTENGTDFQFKVSHSVGNFFVEGNIGNCKIQMFKVKDEGFDIWLGPDHRPFKNGEHDHMFKHNDRVRVTNFLRSIL